MDPAELQDIDDDLLAINSYVDSVMKTSCVRQQETAIRMALKELFCFMKKRPDLASFAGLAFGQVFGMFGTHPWGGGTVTY